MTTSICRLFATDDSQQQSQAVHKLFTPKNTSLFAV